MRILNCTRYEINYFDWDGIEVPVERYGEIQLEYQVICTDRHPIYGKRIDFHLEIPEEVEEAIKPGDIILISKDMLPFVREIHGKLLMQVNGVIEIFVLNEREIKQDEKGRKFIDKDAIYGVE